MHLLMCPPICFDVVYEINPWMNVEVAPDLPRASAQWSRLYKILVEQLSVRVSLIDPYPGFPDMVFTANAGLVYGQTFIPSTFKHKERQGEMDHFRKWFANHGYLEKSLPEGTFEGEGDALWYGKVLLAGYGPRSARDAHPYLEEILGHKVASLGLVDGRYYHLDVCLAPVNPDLLVYYPPAFDQEANCLIERLPGDKIELTAADADYFGGNMVVVGKDVVLNDGAEDLAAALSRRGYRVHMTDLSEFLKAGGSAKCLVLTLEA